MLTVVVGQEITDKRAEIPYPSRFSQGMGASNSHLTNAGIYASLACCQWCKIYFGWRPNLQDEGDNHLIELVVAGGANYIITTNVRDFKNGELLFDGLNIVTPQQFIKEALWA